MDTPKENNEMTYGYDPRTTCWIEDLDVYGLLDNTSDDDTYEIDLGGEHRFKFNAFGWINAVKALQPSAIQDPKEFDRLKTEAIAAIAKDLAIEGEVNVNGGEGVFDLTYAQWSLILTALDKAPGPEAAIEWDYLQEIIADDLREDLRDAAA